MISSRTDQTSQNSFTLLPGTYEGWDTRAMLADVLLQVFPGRIALVSSFGTDSAALLHLVATIEPATPVIFLETGKLFPETLQYQLDLTRRLNLTDVRVVRPNPRALADDDPVGNLWDSNPDLCCWHRKVEPLDAALAGFRAWITGRKRFQGALRTALPRVEHDADGRTKVNPLADWSEADVLRYMLAHDLPQHPLKAQGFRSVGCAPCSRASRAGEGVRDGRWAGRGKTECGIHLPRAPAHAT
ncbi:MAG TPA: phosphoadenylyl-sulfate reductase [Rhodopila sp.]|nr:phosphoadenylyl-sulfate reductase [Rhodopila sp.]